LWLGVALQKAGNDVSCVDINAEKVAKLKAGEIPIYEPGLPELVERNMREERLNFTTDLADAVKKSLVIFLAVGTPTTPSGAADLSAVFAVAAANRQGDGPLQGSSYKVDCTGRNRQKIREIIKQHTKHPFDVVSNPEFLKQGAAVEDFMKPDRVVVGADDPRPAEILRDLYAPFVEPEIP
jgi:UDPglucose 6-dehydrogenase